MGSHILESDSPRNRRRGFFRAARARRYLMSGLTAIAGFGSFDFGPRSGIHSLGIVMAAAPSTSCMVASAGPIFADTIEPDDEKRPR